MAAPGIAVEFVDRLDQAGTQRIEVDISHQLEQVFLFLADQRLVAVLEKMTGAGVAEVESDRVAGQQPPHESGQRDLAGAQQQMEMVVDQRPGETVGLGGDQQIREPPDELAPVVIVGEDLAFLDPADDDVLQEIGDVYTGGSWHGEEDSRKRRVIQLFKNVPLVYPRR